MAQNNQSTTVMTAETTKRGLISLWECGGGCCNTGEATIITRPDGSKPTAVYIPRGGHLSNGNHALIPVHTGYYIIKSWHHRKDFEHIIYKILKTFSEEGKGKIEVFMTNQREWGEWSTPLPDELKAAVAAAEEKATDYHCRKPYYVVEKEKKD